MIKRGVKPHNLVGIRQRILTKFLQIVRSPEHNPEIARYEKVSRLICGKIIFLRIAIFNPFLCCIQQLPVPVLHADPSQLGVPNSTAVSVRPKSGFPQFCYSCRRHLPKSKFKAPSGEGSSGGDTSSSTGTYVPRIVRQHISISKLYKTAQT